MFSNLFHKFWHDKRFFNKLTVDMLNHGLKGFIRISCLFLKSELKTFRIMSMRDNKTLMDLCIYWNELLGHQNVSLVDRVNNNKIMVFWRIIKIEHW